MITNTEFYITPQGDVMIQSLDGARQLQFSDREFISKLYKLFLEFYPDAVKSLARTFDKFTAIPAMLEFCIVRRMIKCNFGKYDSVLDIDHLGNLNFEEVECPLRGECHQEGIVCKPRFNSKLSSRELEIMKLHYNQIPKEDIAEHLCISVDTVKTHKRNAFRKVNVHSLPEFFKYANQNNLFNH